jgi:hypothetical protein
MKKHHKYTLLFLVLFSFSCNTSKNNFRKFSIEGTWYLNKKQVDFPSISFKSDNTCIFSSMGDTLYRFKYKIKDEYLILTDINNNISKDKIMKISKDSLVFEKLWTNSSIQIYTRKETK